MQNVQSGGARGLELKTAALDHAHDEATPLVEWTRTPMRHCRPKEEYASVRVANRPVLAGTSRILGLIYVSRT